MSPVLGPISFEDADSRLSRQPYSKRLASMMDEEANKIITKAYKRTETLLIEHRDMLRKVNISICVVPSAGRPKSKCWYLASSLINK